MSDAQGAQPHRRLRVSVQANRVREAGVLQDFGAVFVLIAVSAFLTVAQPDSFGNLDTARTLLTTQTVLAILAIGVLFPLVVGEFDLSVGAILGFAALVTARLDGPEGLPALAAVIAAIGVSALVGAINGALVTRANIPSFVATLGVGVMLAGAADWISDGTTISENISSGLTEAGTTLVGGIPIAAFYLLAVGVLAWFVLELTVFGRYLRAVGANARSAELAGLPVRRLRFVAFVIAGSVAGLAGALHMMQIGSAHPSAGPPLLLPAYAAVFLGSTTIRPGRFNVIGTVVAVFLIAVVITGVQLYGAPSWVEYVLNGGALLIAVAISLTGRRGAFRA